MTRKLLAIGFISLLAQVALLRELNVLFHGSELNMVLALGAWLLGTALGAARAGRPSPVPDASGTGLSERQAEAPAAIGRAFLLTALMIPLAVVWTRGARHVLGGVPGAYLPFPTQLFATAVALLPVSITLGLLFRLVARRAVAAGWSLAAAYAVECAGALLGGGAATLALRADVPNLSAALGAALLASVMAGPRRGPGLVAAAALVAAFLASPVLDRAMTAWEYPHLIATRDSPYGRVTITAWGDQINIFENGSLAFETGGTAAEEFVAFAALAHPAPRRVLVLGGGTAGLVHQVLAHGPEDVVSIETDRVVTATITHHLPAGMREDLSSPRVRLVHDDPRRYLMQSDGRADLILVGMPEPSSGQTNRYYTQEFFAECAAHLNAGGVLAFRLPGAENFWSPPLISRLASIERGLAAEFVDVLVLPGAMTLILAANDSIQRDPALLAARLDARCVSTRLVTPAYLRYVLTNERRDEVEALVASADVPANRDAHPVCYRYTLAIWLSKFYPTIARFEATGRAGWRAAGAGALFLVLLWLWGRRRPGVRLAVVVALAGAIGMVLESALLLAYQARCGVLYQDLGLLLMLFMAGLALGAAAVASLGRRRERLKGILFLGGLAALGVALAVRLDLGTGPGRLEAGAWLMAAGATTAAVFAQASRMASDELRAVGPLYAVDVAGGCVGSLAASLILIPLFGLPATALTMAALALVALLWW